jgi:hypothetical protein
MAQPVWNTPKGDLGTYNSDIDFRYVLSAYALFPAGNVTFKILNGKLPDNVTLSADGIISGHPWPVKVDTVSTFTIRVTDNLGEFRDRTFFFTILGGAPPAFLTSSGFLLDVKDGTWVSYPLRYTNPISMDSVEISLVSGKIPPGLEISRLGVISGYADQPKTLAGYPTDATFKFTLKLTNDLGSAMATYQITVRSQSTVNNLNNRAPAILNYNPRTLLRVPEDPYYAFYLNSNKLPVIKSGNYFSFKVIGYDFDSRPIGYEFFDLPLGLVGDETTGWVTGTPVLANKGIFEFLFKVRVRKLEKYIVSDIYEFVITVTNDVDPVITWNTPNNLGTINNNTISDYRVSANSSANLEYELYSGTLPPNLELLDNGEIVGKVANQPTTKPLKKGDNTKFTFQIRAYSPDYPVLSSIREFTINVHQYYAIPTDTMYFKAAPSLADRAILSTLLDDEYLIPNEFLYKPRDRYFGKASDIKFVQVYGVNASSIEQYISAIAQNHYWRDVTLGEVKTAIAKDDFGNLMYEVVYCEVIDDLARADGTSVNQKIRWPKTIDLNRGPWITSEGEVYASYSEDLAADVSYYTSLAPGSTLNVYPASFQNMRKRIADVLDENYDSRLLPRWMRSQQDNGSILGYVQAWVIAYTLPGKASTIRDRIKNEWPHKLNEIYFKLDRYVVDKSDTYDYNTYLSTPTWQNLPSSPKLETLDEKDFYVLFPRKTILPK